MFVHVYIHHFDKLVGIGAVSHSCSCLYFQCYFIISQEAHINTCYKHFYYFVNQFKMVDPKEFEPLVRTLYLLAVCIVQCFV